MDRKAPLKKDFNLIFNKDSVTMNNLLIFKKATFFILLSWLPASAFDATEPGKVTTPYPTITNLAVEWLIKGDEDLDGTVEVEYRMEGENKWRKGMPLRRIPAGRLATTFTWENRHSGSIFDLKPDTGYEIRLRLSDPDGGSAERTVRARTRPVPRAAPDATVKKVNPRSFRDSLRTAHPGDILLLSPGYYRETFIPLSGEPGKPIVIRADGAHEVINSTFDSISFPPRCKHIILDGLTVNGTIDLRFTEDITVRRCTVNAKYGIIAKEAPGCRNCYIADNVVTYVMPWVRLGMCSGMVSGGAACVGEGIEITGPGNVICHNRVTGYRDCISTMEGYWVHEQKCIDIYNNDIYVGADDAIEADFCMGNCRIMRNRITNCTMGLSSQPGLGGPTYFIRNVMYNITHSPYKLSRGSRGDVILHNTTVKVGDGFRVVHAPSLTFFRNNLTIGGKGGCEIGKYTTGTGLAVCFPRANPTCDMDYDGIGTHGTPFKGQIGEVKFNSFAELTRLTPEKHAVQVDMTVFRQKVEFPDPPVPEREPADLRLKAGSAAVDAGVVIPNVNDNYTGKTPDLGAYELGDELPVYGPRPPGVDEETMWIERHH
ncbi:MAG: right-handed parallel beta-helix repeat-containing protein [Gemmatimonadota bacterium]|nr:right-handed parallel beta-helix repeat-containing protein [Gemmatimonadota bacterium]